MQPTNPEISRYFDNAATTPLDPRVLREMLPFLESEFGNPNSIHSLGQRARYAVERARTHVAELIGAEDPSQVIFTSGATEGNNQVLSSYPNGAVSPFEHSTVREPAAAFGLELLGSEDLLIIPPKKPFELISCMTVNNEIGTIWHPGQLNYSAEHVHSDITQAVGKIPIDLTNLSFATFSGHKFFGPKGVGGLYIESTAPKVLFFGGEQESHVRAGTLNVAGIVGMGAAAQIASDELDSSYAQAKKLRNIVLEGLDGTADFFVNGGLDVSPYILSLSFDGVEGETLVIEMDHAGYAISSGAACSSGSTEPSHVLTALGIDQGFLRGTVRVSFGRFCSNESASGLSKSLRHAVDLLRRMH